MWGYLLISVISGLIAFKLTLILYRRRKYPEPHYDWANVNLEEVSFPENFLWGAATAAHQIEGSLTNNWTDHEENKNLEAEKESNFLP